MPSHDQFSVLLTGYHQARQRSRPGSAAMFEDLLQRYRTACSRQGASSANTFPAMLTGWKTVTAQSNEGQGARISQMLLGWAAAVDRWRASQATSAEDLNVLDLLDVATDELRHSRMVAWMLDRRGTHAQGTAGLGAFLAEVGLPPAFAEGDYRVRREVHGEASRIDVEVAAAGRFIVHIEVKILAGEGDRQLVASRMTSPAGHGFSVSQTNAHTRSS